MVKFFEKGYFLTDLRLQVLVQLIEQFDGHGVAPPIRSAVHLPVSTPPYDVSQRLHESYNNNKNLRIALSI